MNVRHIFLFVIFLLTSAYLSADPTVTVNLNVKHSVGGISEFDRSKYMVMHSIITTPDWSGEEDKLDYLLNDLDVYLGRDNGTMVWNARLVNQDPNRPGYADPKHIRELGKYNRETQYGEGLAARHKYEDRLDVMAGGQLSQFWIGNHKGKDGWSFVDTTAVGEFMGHFLNEYFREDDQSPKHGHKRPRYMEIVNEPLYELVDVHKGKPIDTFIYHNEVSTAIRKVNDSVMIGGYTTAFPWFDDNDFKRWHERMKLFIDTSGDHMDYFSIHLYDFNYLGRDKGVANFKGGRIEATMDMMEQYELLALGKIKPFMISEYGGRDHKTEQDVWSSANDWHSMKAFTPMMLQFMAKPDIILKAIPFMLTKAEWAGNEGRDYPWRLLRHNDEKEGEKGGQYVFSDQVKFYELWSDVKGTRVLSHSEEADVLVDSYVNGDKAYVILSNLVKEKQVVDLTVVNSGKAKVSSVKIRHLHEVDLVPTLTEKTLTTLPSSIAIEPEASTILEYSFNRKIKIKQLTHEHKYYAKTYLQPIKSAKPNVFEIDDVKTSKYGEGVLRLSFGRVHGLSLKPVVKINGNALNVPSDFPGDSQKYRPQFFSMLEIEVPNKYLNKENDISVEFSDEGGFVTSVTLAVHQFSHNIRKKEKSISMVKH